MWVLLIVYILQGELEVEKIVVDSSKECYATMNGVKGQALRAQKPVELRCVEIPDEKWTEEQM